MTRHNLVFAIALAAACVGRADRAPSTDARAPGDSVTPVDSAAPIVPAAPAASPQSTLGHLMAGTWDISPSGVGGPHLSITVRSTRGDTFHGELTRALAGDVLLDEARFERFTGTVGADSVARVTINWLEKGPPPTELVGKISGGEWRLTRFVWGGEQQVRPGRTWTGRRAKP